MTKKEVVSAVLALAVLAPWQVGAQESAAPAASAGGPVGTVIFFREKKFAGAAIRYKVREDGKELCKLKSGSFCTLQVPVGKHTYTVHSEAKDVLTMEVESGETYYVLGALSMGVFAGHPNLSPSDQATFDKMKDKLADNTGKDLKDGDDKE
jgi:hypothetical protein